MPIFLPKSMLVDRRFKCPSCAFAFIMQTPSQVEKCPKCTHVVFDRNYKEGDVLDPYSKAKLRWYTTDQNGDYHRDEIKRRVTKVDQHGRKYVVVVDEHGRELGEIPTFSAIGTKLGTKENIRPA